MLCNPISNYPDSIDPLIFFQDISLEKVGIMEAYNDLTAQGRYGEASDHIARQENICGFFADFFNLAENRIYALQDHLLHKPPRQPFIYYDEEEHFPLSSLHLFTDTDAEEDLSSIALFSDIDEQESVDELYMFTGEEGQPPVINRDTVWV